MKKRRNKRDRDGLTASERYEVQRYLDRCSYRYDDMIQTCDRIAHKLDRMTSDIDRMVRDVRDNLGRTRW